MESEEAGRIPAGLVGAAAVLAALVGTLLWLSMLRAPWQLASGLLGARHHLDRAEKALEKAALKDARFETLSAVAAADRAASGMRSDSPLFDIARLVPVADRGLEESDHLVAAAEHSSRAARGTLDIAQNALRGPDKLIAPDPDDPEGGDRIRLERVEEIERTIEQVRRELAEARKELRAVKPANLPARFRSPIKRAIKRAQDSDELLADAEAGFAILPDFLGREGPRRYLIGMQNPAEERGTGGSILQFALITIDDGKLKLDRSSKSVYEVDRERERIDIPLPEDAWYVAGIPDAQRFGNANWSPDWPLSAKLTLDYAYASDPDFPVIDGVIGVDPLTMRELMPGVGRFKLPKTGNYMTAQTVAHFVLYKAYATFPSYQGIRRRVLKSVVDEFYERMLHPAHPTELAEGFGRALSQKHTQVWLTDPEEQAFVERMDWDGAIRPAKKSDYLYVVEQNVGGNKLDYYDRQTTKMRVDLTVPDATVSTEVEVRNGVFIPQPHWSMGDWGPLHRPMINVYVPENAELVDYGVAPDHFDWTVTPAACDACNLLGTGPFASRLDDPVPATWVGGRPAEHHELGKKVWSATLQIPPQETASVTYDYVVPGVVRTLGGRNVYRLIVQHQPKARPELLQLEVTLPAGARAIVSPGFKREGQTLVWDKPLTKDLDLEISWQS